MSFLLNFHPAVSVLFLCIVTVFLSYLGLRIVRKKFAAEVIRENHEVGGFIFNAFGLIYAVLVAFVVFVTWNEFDESRANIDAEASEIADLYNTSKAFPDSMKQLINRSLTEYAGNVINDEWGRMESGGQSEKADNSFGKLWTIYSTMDTANIPNVPVYHESLKHLNDLGERRRARILDSISHIPGIIWASLLFGGIMSVIFTYFFSAKRFAPQVFMTSMLTVLNTLILYMIYLLDHPFTGTMKLNPEAFEYVIALIKSGI